MIYWERVFFILLADTSQEVINTEMQDAYEDFVKQIVTISHSEDYTHVFRMLNLTRIEIAPLKGCIRMGWGGNTLKNLYIHKALSLIGAELELLNLKTTHPEQFNSPVSTGKNRWGKWNASPKNSVGSWLWAAFQSEIW